VEIKGHVLNIPSNKVYLTSAYQWKTFIDSADYSNGEFTILYKTDYSFQPFVASICFINKQGIIQQLAYKNNILSSSNKEFGNTSFVLEPGVTTINGKVDSVTYNSTNNLEITAGKETEVYFKTQFLNFGLLGESDSSKRKERLMLFKRLIDEYPSSYYLLLSINNYKRMYSNKELSYLLSFFDKGILKSKTAIEISNLISMRNNPPQPFVDLSFMNEKGVKKKIIDTSFRINVIILWASWCGPCRMEISELKRFKTKFEHRSLHMCSISLDLDKSTWKQAIKSENMEWDQFIIVNTELDNFKNIFNISAIPITILCDKNGTELSRFNGYDSKQGKDMEEMLDKYLNK
jgi:thiol-disulfide isomerase/thioredoxin